MTTSVLADIFRKMDLLGITKRGFNADGTPFKPAAIIDGHVSRMGEPFLVYISDDDTRWYVVLGAPYGTAFWQVHDDTRENGQFKMELASAQSALFQKKRVKGFNPNLVAEDIVIILQPAISKSFNIVKYAKKAISIRGWYPFNRAPLDLPEILSTAPEEVRKERVRILEARGVHSNFNTIVPPMEYNLLLSVSGALAGGAAVSNALAQTVTELNYTSATVSDVLALAQRTKAVNDGRNNNMAPNAARGNMMTSNQLRDTYRDVQRMTAGTVFGKGNGVLGPEVRDEVVRRIQARRACIANQDSKKKKILRDLKRSVEVVRAKMLTVSFNLTVKDLTTLCRWKKTKEDGKMPTKRSDLEALWRKIENDLHRMSVLKTPTQKTMTMMQWMSMQFCPKTS